MFHIHISMFNHKGMVSFVTKFPFVFYHTQIIYQFVDVASYVTYYPSSF